MSGRSDRILRLADLVLLGVVAGCATRGAPAVSPTSPELWCDAAAPAGGDGSRARPRRALPAEVPSGTQAHASTGVYPGPVRLGPGASLTGHGLVVVASSGPGAVVSLQGASLHHVSVQGGEVGVTAEGEVRLDQVHFSGQRIAALRALPGATVSARRLELVGTLPGADGLTGEGAVFSLAGARFTGALRRAMALKGGAVSASGLVALGPATLLHAVDAEVTVQGASAEGGAGPALFAAGGRLVVQGLTVVGHEYAVQATRTQVRLEGVTSRGAQRAGLALHRTSGSVRGAVVERAGDEGGLHLDQADTVLDDVSVRGARSWGVLVRLGSAVLGALTVDSVAAEPGGGHVLGEGLVVRDARVDGGVVTVRDVEGAGLLATAQAGVHLEALEVERVGGPGAMAERGAELSLGRLQVRGSWGPALVVSEGGQASVGTLSSTGAEVPVWADCETGAQVTLGSVRWTGTLPPSRCVRQGGSGNQR